MAAWIGPALSVLGSGIKGLFGFKGKQADVLNSAVKVIGDVTSTAGQRHAAVAAIITAEANSRYWLPANIRPLILAFFTVLIGARWFGYVPDNMSEAELLEVYSLVKLGLGGYIGGRTLEKIIGNIGLSKILRTFIEKKIL